jgi:hypothetical protein
MVLPFPQPSGPMNFDPSQMGGPPPGLMGPLGLPGTPVMPDLSGMSGLPGMPPASPTPLVDAATGDPSAMAALEYILNQVMQDDAFAEQGVFVPEKPKKPKRKAPSIEDIQRKADRAVSRWLPRDQRMDEDLLLYRLTQSTEGEGEVVTKNTPAIVVDKAAAMLASQTPVIRIIAPHPEAKESAQKVEDFLRWSWVQWNKTSRRSLKGALSYSMAHYLCLRGWITMRIEYDDTVAEYKNPIKLRLFDPRSVYPMESDNDLAYVIHKSWMTYQELRDEWEEAASKYADQEDDDPVEVIEFYDSWWHCVMVDGEAVVPVKEHGYGFVPWIITTGAGSPIRITPRDQQQWPRDVGVSIFHSIRASSKSLDKILSQLATQVANAANPPTIYYYDPILNASPQPLDYTPGTTNYLLYDRERVDPLNLSPIPTNVQPLMDSLIDDISRGSLHPVLWGQGGTASGFSLSFLTDAAKDQLFPIIDGMQDAMMQTNEFELQLIRDLHDTEIGFWVKGRDGQKLGGVTITPEEVEEVGCENEVIYRNVAPKDLPILAQMASMLTKDGLLDRETAIEDYLLKDNPQQIIQRSMEDAALMDPDLMKKGIIPALLLQDNPEMGKLYLAMHLAEIMGKNNQNSSPDASGGGGLPPGILPTGAPQGPGLPPQVMPPIMQPGADLLGQSIGSSAGGMGLGLPQGIGGGGALPLGLPLGA